MSKWTVDQERAITESGSNIIVSAGAGSGKTAVLTERTIRKLLNGTDINRLLILTFTNLAAGEMKNRIRASIKKADLKEQLDYIDSAYITTFDSYALSIVKKYYYLIDISPNLSIMDNSIQVLKTNEILNSVFESSYGNPHFDKLINDFCIKSDDNIKSIIKDISGKLDIIPNKKDYLNSYIDTHYNNECIEKEINKYLNIIMSEKDNIKELYKELIYLVDDKFIKTYNLGPLIESNTYDEIKSNLSIVGSPRKNNNCDPSFSNIKDKINSKIKLLKELTRFNSIDYIKESIYKTKDYISAICEIIIKFDEQFLQYKNQHDLYTFSDIALMSIKLLKEHDYVREEIKTSFDEIMIDEYQDTSNIQEEFINLISSNNVYMVGDIKQSIYRFRHANPYIFRDKYNKYSNGDGGIKIDLLKNFRSREEVINNINLIFNLIMDDYIGDANYRESHQMNFGNINYNENCKVTNRDMDIYTYDKNELKEYSTDEIEAFKVAYDIKEKLENKYQVVDKNTNLLRDVQYSDFAIIMDRGTSFGLYKKIFEYVGVPLIQIKNEKLTISDDIVVLKNLIKLIVKIYLKEYDDEFKYMFVSVSRSFLFKIEDSTIFDIVNSNKYFETELYKICSSINITELSSLDLLDKIISKFKFYDKLLIINNIEESLIRLDYLKELSINLSNIGYTPIMFSKYLDEMMSEDAIEYSLNTENSNSVKILNIHKSKGLEYSICYFTGLSKKSNNEGTKSKFIVDSNYNIIVPFIDNGIKETIYKDLLLKEEERQNISEKIRLFYVALTRAKEKIIIMCPLDTSKDGYDYLVPRDERLNYNRISDMLQSIIPVLMPYIKNIDLNDINITHDYNLMLTHDYLKKVKPSNKIINKTSNKIIYSEKTESKFSKVTNRLITREEYKNLKQGTDIHYVFELEDFKTTTNDVVKRFIKHIDLNYINCYKEYEFIYNNNNEIKHGFIDLMLEYEDKILIIDYKLKNILDEKYIEQLKGYKEYIENLTSKSISIYLYSIKDDRLTDLEK